MTSGAGDISRTPQSRMRLVLWAQLFWLAVVLVLGAWWARLLLQQAALLDELQFGGHLKRMQNMLLWESGTFFLILAGSTGALVWLHYRDLKRSRGLQAFFASVTHELKTPLTSIRLQAEALGQNDNPLVKRLLEDTSRLESQVERTLELARVEGGGAVYLQSVRLKPVLERILAPLKDSHYSDHLDIKNTVDSEISVQADPAGLQVIFRNLIENSVRHSQRPRVHISIKAGEGTDSHTYCLTYQDDGAGFEGDASKLGRIFEKGPQSQGAGVGLYLIRALMTRMGGSARFDGQQGFKATLQFMKGVSADV